MIGGGLQEVEAVRQLKAAGWTVGVSDRDSDCPCANIADYVLEADGRDPERILQELLIRTPDNLPRVVFTLTELTTTVAILLHALKLPAPSILSVVVSQSKALSKDCWLRKGVRTPNGVVVSDAQGLASIPTRSAPPYVIKPDVSSGGRGVVLVKSADKLSEAVRNAIDCSANSRCVVEEYIHGTIHDGNAYFSNGIFVPLSISDRFTGDSIAVESGAICPSCLPPNKQKDFFFLFEESCRALGIEQGPVKIDALYDGKNFYVLEVAARLHGPRGSLYLIPASFGISLCVPVFDAIQSNSMDIEWDATRVKQFCVYEDIRIAERGVIISIEGIEIAKHEEGIVDIQLLKNIGDEIRTPHDSNEVTGFIFAVGSNEIECRKRIKTAHDVLHIRLVNRPHTELN
ncbi:MAG: CarB family protein [Parcubacteria group bacterium GW2011_GWA1_56_13]|nr:MAG: CarB family protein [Parcubacteria group bacterium GW2011_GWA1_56_13]